MAEMVQTAHVACFVPYTAIRMTNADAQQSNPILVTGGAGFIGSNFVLSWMKAASTGVVNLDLLTYAGNAANLAALEADLRLLDSAPRAAAARREIAAPSSS